MRALGIFFFGIFFSAYLAAMNSSPIPPENIIKLVFMGKTGAGKSTTINSCYNFAKSMKWNDYPKHFPICTDFQPCNVPQYQGRLVENHARQQLSAVTQEPSEYVAQGRSYVVHLIDCPGMADPRGIETDIENTEKIAQFLARVGQFNALIIVLKSTTNRETAEEQYFIEQVKTVIPSSAYNRIFIIATYTTLPSHNVDEFAKSVDLPVENIFYFDNYALTKEGYIDLSKVSLETTTMDDDIGDAFSDEYAGDGGNDSQLSVAKKVQEAYPNTHREFNRMLQAARKLGKHHSGEMAEISRMKSEAKDKIFAAYRKVESIEETEAKLDDARHKLQLAKDAYDRAKESRDAVEQEVELAKAEKEAAEQLKEYEEYYDNDRDKTPEHHTNCLNCAFTCHPNCGLDDESGFSHLTQCTAITNGYCTACPGHCSYSYHSHEKFVWKKVKRQRPLKNNVQRKDNAKSSYDSSSSRLSEKEGDVAARDRVKTSASDLFYEINARLEQLKEEKDGLQHEIVALYVELGRVCISSINFQIGEYYDLKIRNEQDPLKRAKLNRDRQFYEEQVELYRKKQREAQAL